MRDLFLFMEVRIENIVSRSNLKKAYRQVVGNGGSSGVDGMKVKELKSHLQEYWEDYKAELLTGKYNPSLIRRVSVGKTEGGDRHLGIPKKKANMWANTRKGYLAISKSPILQTTIPNKLLYKRGYRSLVSYYEYRHSDLMNRRDTRTVRRVV